MQRNRLTPKQSGFSLIELLIAVTILLAVSGIVMTAMVQMTRSQASINNRTDMHSSVRSVTSLMQQEISQAGRISLPPPAGPGSCGGAAQPPCGTTTLTTPITLVDPEVPEVRTVAVGSTAGMFDNILLLITSGGTCAFCDHEVVEATVGVAGTITATFRKNHAAGARIWASGGFVTGILTTANGTVLKMFGDINDDGNMVFVEYICNPDAAGTGTLTRSETPWNAAVKNPAQVLLNNLLINPVDAITGQPVPCFAYQTRVAAWTALDGLTAHNETAVLNVGVTLTARTALMQRTIDNPATPIDDRYDYETKALLTVSPRNAYQAYEMSTDPGVAPQMVQITPTTINGGPTDPCCVALLDSLP